MLLEGKNVLITGAASPRGIGKASALLFARHGARVAILDLDAGAAQGAAAQLPGKGHIGVGGNVALRADCQRCVKEVLAAFGHVDALLNIAGITSPQRVMEIDEATYERIMDVNLRGTLLMTQAVLPHMRARCQGAIVNMSSVSAQRGGGVFGGAHYSAAKAGILGLTKACAREAAPDNVRVNVLCPGFIDTDITAGQLKPEQLAAIVASTPLGRAGTAEEVASCALFLASDLSSYVTGSEIDVNGGSLIH